MTDFLPIVAVIFALFILCFALMNIGLFLRGKKMSGGCGSGKSDKKHSKVQGCGFCSEKKKLNLCSSENKTDLKDISKLGTLGRYESHENE